MRKDVELEHIRANAAGKEPDGELVKQFPVRKQYETEFPTRYGNVKVYVFLPVEKEETALPVIVNFHGGGFVKGYQGRDIVFSRNLAYHTGYAVIDVDYKVAPEYRYPYALEEGYDAVKYIAEHGEEYGIDGSRIMLSGQSAGANLAAGIALMVNQSKELRIRLVMLSYPPLDLARDPGDKRFADQNWERVERGRLYNEWYIDEERRKEIYVSPVYASEEDLKGLPPFLIITAEKDTLGEEAEKFAYQLLEAGVTVTAKRVNNAEHGFLVRRDRGFEEAETLIFMTAHHYG